MAKTVVALYDNFNDAQNAVQDLINGGFRRDDLSLVANDETRAAARDDADATGVNAATSAGEGAGIGAALGGVAGLLVGLGALAIPGIGPVLAAGPIAAALAGMGIGAVTGGLIGALMDAGIPESEARYYAEGVRRGGTLVTVRTSDDMLQRAIDLLNQHHPADIHQRATQWQEAGWTGYDTQASREVRTTTGDVSAYDEDFRRNYQRAYADMGYNYDQFQPAYRYGFDLGHSENYEGRNWDEIEGQARNDWEQRHPNTNWDQFKEAVHYGWERAAGQGENDTTMRPSGPTQGGQTYNQGQTGPAGNWQQHPTENVDQLPQGETTGTTNFEERPASQEYAERDENFSTPTTPASSGRPAQTFRPVVTADTPDQEASLQSYEQGGQTTDEDQPYNRGQQQPGQGQQAQSGSMIPGSLSEEQRYGMQHAMEEGDPNAESPRLRQDDAEQRGEHSDFWAPGAPRQHQSGQMGGHSDELMSPDDQQTMQQMSGSGDLGRTGSQSHHSAGQMDTQGNYDQSDDIRQQMSRSRDAGQAGSQSSFSGSDDTTSQGNQSMRNTGDTFAQNERFDQGHLDDEDQSFGQGEVFDHGRSFDQGQTHPQGDQFSDAGLTADINQERGPAGGYTSEPRGGAAYNRDVEPGVTGHPERDLSENRGGEDFGKYQSNDTDMPVILAGDSPATGVSPAATGAQTSGSVNSLANADEFNYDTRFRGHYDSNYAGSGQTFGHYEPAYRYGYHMASDQRYSGQDWDHVEMQARQDWERDNPNTPWDKVKAAVRHAWESATGNQAGGSDRGDYR